MLVRFLGRFGAAQEVESAPFYSRLAYRYLSITKSLKKSGIETRLVSTVPADMGRRSIWYPYADLFLTALTTPCLNLVCGDVDDAERLWTADMPNVIITAIEHLGKGVKMEALSKYDLIIAPSAQQASLLPGSMFLHWSFDSAVIAAALLAELERGGSR